MISYGQKDVPVLPFVPQERNRKLDQNDELMKKKFDFTAEMKEAQITKSTPQNEYLEEEKRLLGINVKELAELNDNVYGLRTDLTAFIDLLGKYKLSITQDTQEQAVKFGNTVLGQFIDQIEIKCTEAEQRIAQMDNRISLSHKAFYILIVILIALSSFLVCMIVANVEFLHSWLIWRMVAACGLIAILGVTMVMVVSYFLPR